MSVFIYLDCISYNPPILSSIYIGVYLIIILPPIYTFSTLDRIL